jgi:hypothetical protein
MLIVGPLFSVAAIRAHQGARIVCTSIVILFAVGFSKQKYDLHLSDAQSFAPKVAPVA